MDPSGYLGYLSNPGTLEYASQNSEPIDYGANRWRESWNAIQQGGGGSSIYNHGSFGGGSFTLGQTLAQSDPLKYRPGYFDREIGEWKYFDELTRQYYYNKSTPYWGTGFVRVEADMNEYVRYVRDFGVQSTRIYIDALNSGDSNLGGIINATLLMAGGVAEIAFGGAIAFFTAGTSTPLTVPLMIDGAGRTVANAQRLRMYLRGNHQLANAYPTSLGGAIGKIGDLINGTPMNQVGNGQVIVGSLNDCVAFAFSGGSGFALQEALITPTFSNWALYGFTLVNYNYSLYDNVKHINP